jgi:hypothetical protein
VKLAKVAVFGIGYLLGTRAGRERYAQIVAAAQRASQRLEAYGSGGSFAKSRGSAPRPSGTRRA